MIAVKGKPLFSFLLALLMPFLLLPTPVLAAEESPHAGQIGDSAVTWRIEAGNLFIGGSGSCAPFHSADDQPWAAHRQEITAVWFDTMDALAIEDIAYWFTGCTQLESAEIPYTTQVVGTAAFADCPKLRLLMFYYDQQDFMLVPGAFLSEEHVPLKVAYVAASEHAEAILYAFNWTVENRCVIFADVYGTVPLATGYCSYCGKTCAYTSRSCTPWTDRVHMVVYRCAVCGNDQNLGTLSDIHTFSHYNNTTDICVECGYTIPCSCGLGVCYHTRTYTNWSGCYWYSYCYDCGQLVNSGVSHGSYIAGSVEYDSNSYHRVYYSCANCGEGYYSYEFHSTYPSYSQYSSTQHRIQNICSICGGAIGSVSFAGHSFSYGAWFSYSSTQHRRLKTCTTCGYSEYESGSHADSNNDGLCDNCGYSMRVFSVTVPTGLTLSISELGEVYSASNVAIINNSTGAVEITGLNVSAVNDWTLVPYASNMASEKVDAKRIGFALNGAQSMNLGVSEALSLPGAWTIASGSSLPLSYGAVVSAMSQPVSEQVLTVVFVLEWAGK